MCIIYYRQLSLWSGLNACLNSQAAEHIKSERVSIFLQPWNSLQVTITFPSTPGQLHFLHITFILFFTPPLQNQNKTNKIVKETKNIRKVLNPHLFTVL